MMTNALSFLAETGAAGRVQEIARTFGVDWPHLIAQTLSFAIVCALLYKFAYRRVLAMLEERRTRIAEGLANAERIKAELARTEAGRKDVMAEARAQAARFLEDAHAAAARVQEREIERAMAAARQIADDARDAAERDHDRMLAELKREVGRLVVETTAAVVGRALTPDDHRRLVLQTAGAVIGDTLTDEDHARLVADGITEKLLQQGGFGVAGNETDQESQAQR